MTKTNDDIDNNTSMSKKCDKERMTITGYDKQKKWKKR